MDNSAEPPTPVTDPTASPIPATGPVVALSILTDPAVNPTLVMSPAIVMRKRKNFLWWRCTMPWHTALWSFQLLQWVLCCSNLCDRSCGYSDFCDKSCGSSSSCSCIWQALWFLQHLPWVLWLLQVWWQVQWPSSSPAMNPTVNGVASLLWQNEDSLCESLCLSCWKNSFNGSKKKK